MSSRPKNLNEGFLTPGDTVYHKVIKENGRYWKGYVAEVSTFWVIVDWLEPPMLRSIEQKVDLVLEVK